MAKGTSLKTGKRGELGVFMKLLEENFTPYVPIVDDEGRDAVVRTPDGRYLGIQIKTRKPEAKYRRYFEVSNFQASGDFFIVCVEDQGDTWIIPSFVFKKYGTTSGKGTCGLDLDQAPGHFLQRKRKDILAPYKNNWDLLKKSEEDLVDLIAMYEALAAPEEERADWENYKKQREQRVHSQAT